MQGTLKAFGWILISLGALTLLCAPVAAFDPEAEASIAVTFTVLGSLFLVPGLLLLRAGRKRQAADRHQLLMVGFVRSHDAFSIDELAGHLGIAPEQARAELSQEIARYRLPLVVHRKSGRYLRLDRLSRQARVADRCHSCGASIGNQIVFEGEQLSCEFCGVTVETHVPQAHEQAWQPPPHAGHWAQTQWTPSHYAPPQPVHAPPQPAYAPPQPVYAPPHPIQHSQPPGQNAPGGWGRPPGR